MELYYLGRDLKGNGKYELVVICDGSTDVEKIKTLAKTVGGVYSYSDCPPNSCNSYHSVEFESKHLREVMDFVTNRMTENKKHEEEKYFALITGIPNDNNVFYKVYASLPKEIGDRVIRNIWPMAGLICYELEEMNEENICGLSIKFSNPYAVMRFAENLVKFGIDVSNMRPILSGHFNTIQYTLQTMGGEK